MSDPVSADRPITDFERRFGHPPGLFVLFFAEMWERFSYYGMRALLVFYMTKGFLGYGDAEAYSVYGAYTSLVYATPFIGGALADRFLGARQAVVIGGALMAAGHLLMTIEQDTAFFMALALLIVGNGFFKPNISTMVGALYPEGSPKRDGGFTLFYMGINLGAALAPLLCGYVGETYGWHYGFGLATIGMLIGLAVFVAPQVLTQILILAGSVAAAGMMVWAGWEDKIMLGVNAPVALALLVAAAIAAMAVGQGAVPDDIGRPKDADAQHRAVLGPLTARQTIFVSIVVAVPLIAFLVQDGPLAGYVLTAFGALAMLSLLFEALRSDKIERERLQVIFVMMFFSMLFWAFFEQAGSSINNFTDRNVDRVVEERVVTAAEVGQTVNLTLTQEQLGLTQGGAVFTLTDLDKARAEAGSGNDATRGWVIEPSHVGMGVGGSELKASVFQATNAIFIVTFGLIFTAFWGFLGKRGLEPSTPVKFGLGLLQLGMGFGALWQGTMVADPRGMVGMAWLILAYLLHTTGELCLSPVGLSMITKLAPQRIVSTAMGAWFLATAFSGFLAGQIATLTGIGGHGEEGANLIPAPIETLHVYGTVFGQIGIAAGASAVLMFALSPLLNKWMHMNAEDLKGGGH